MSDREGQSGDYGETSAPKPQNPTSQSQTTSPSLINRLGRKLVLPSRPAFIDPKFSRHSRRYLFQAVMGTFAILAVLLFVDSLSQAAIAAALGSSVVILFVHPTSHSASPRALIGGHGLALLLGSAFAVLLFAPWKLFWKIWRRCGILGWLFQLGY